MDDRIWAALDRHGLIACQELCERFLEFAMLHAAVRDRLVQELRAIRKMPGLPAVDRLSGQNEVIEALGNGDVGTEGAMVSLVVHWPMPVWPTWQTAAYVADPRIISRTRTYRDRGIELRLESSARAGGSSALDPT